MSYSITKNTSFLTFASIGQKIISFIYFTIIARIIGVDSTGQYFFAIIFQNVFSVFADFGISQVLTRQIAAEPDKGQKYFSIALFNKTIFGLLAYLILFVAANFLNYEIALKQMIYLAGLTMIFDNLHSLFYAVLRAKQNLKYESLGIVMSQFITLAIGTLALLNHLPIIFLILAYTIPSGLNVIYSGYFVLKKVKYKIIFIFDRLLFKYFLNMAWPFALASIISRFYSYSDSLIMSKILSTKSLGWYSVPYKITMAFQFIPSALIASTYPVFSAFWLKNKEALSELFEKSWLYLFILVMPISAGIFAIANSFITLVYGENYLPSVIPLRIMVVGMIFSFLSLTIGSALNAIGQQKKQTMIMAVALVVNLTLNLILIPIFGIIGAACASLFSNFIVWILGYFLLRKYIKINNKKLFLHAFKAFLPALIMGILVFIFSDKISLFISIPFGILVYFIFLFITGGISKKVILETKIKLFGKTL